MSRIELLDSTNKGRDTEDLENKLHHLVVGQDEAIHRVVRAYQTYLAGMSSVGRPIGNFLFLGPTGTGKTRVVEATAEALLKNPRAVIKIDCAEFQHSHEIAKPIGSPPGYTKRQDDLADVLTEELGAPKRFAKKVQSNSPVIRREPTGVVGVITPWNWPINQFVVKAFPAFATGCTAVHKPSEVAPFTAHVPAEIFREAGVPAGVYNLVDGDGASAGAAISGHPGIRMVSFTGSTAAGIDVAKRAADNVKRAHQELGGKSPNVILDDADLANAVTENIYRLMLNSGQSCHAPTRMLVPFAKMETAKNIAKQVIASITCGDPQTDVYMGPVVSARQWNRIESPIQKGIDEGATLLTGGTGHPGGLETGYYVKPTVFGDVTNDMIVAREEIVGPVLCIIGYKDVDDAVSIANDTVYGLGAYVQSASEERANNVAAA